MNQFETRDVVLVRNFPVETLKKGEIVRVRKMPNGKLYLLNSDGLCFETDAKEHIDFIYGS